ncbi:hypothetical protein NEF87_003777 [Candidatus Lokiarchaeum ossiferum]|uniref:GTP-binding protein n=1 Tax=Candidatus Lokiarchaeum ossiferum TaxID=2951803 RepID=A0ABY6HVE7_9ARCH|nr:hypothetical protein NEF87_003777 [Candidatus Lokiarchaeum sp. B-35]
MSNIAETDDPESIRYQFKIVLLGDGGTGKTCLVNRYCFNEFLDTKLTIGLSFNSYSIPAEENGKSFRIGLSIWDFGGQERFRPLLPQFISGCNGAIYVFDQLAFHSLENLHKEWKSLLHSNAGEVPSILVGTKADLIDESHSLIEKDTLMEYQQNLGVSSFVSTSAKTGKNINEIFKHLVREILKKSPFAKRNIIIP